MKQKTGTEELGASWCMGLREATLRTWLGVGGEVDSPEGARGRAGRGHRTARSLEWKAVDYDRHRPQGRAPCLVGGAVGRAPGLVGGAPGLDG